MQVMTEFVFQRNVTTRYGIAYRIRVSQVSCIGEPATKVVVRTPSGDVIDH